MAEQQYEGGCIAARSATKSISISKRAPCAATAPCSKARAWFAFAPFEGFRYTKGGEADQISIAGPAQS